MLSEENNNNLWFRNNESLFNLTRRIDIKTSIKIVKKIFDN